jgi:predicted PurR-regulated permease PerM
MMVARGVLMQAPNLIDAPHSPDEGWLTRERALALVLVIATGIACFLCYLLARPFLPTLAWALALAVIARPVHDWIAARVRHPGLAAGLAVAFVAVLLIAPASFVLQQLTSEAAGRVEQLQAEAENGRWQATLEQYPRLAPALRWARENLNVEREVQRSVTRLTDDVTSLVKGSVWGVVQLLLTLFALFFFLRDRRAVLGLVRSLVPLSETETSDVFRRVADTIHATVFGTLFVAVIQGTLGGLMFWWLGLPVPILWGTVMALLAVVPWLGAFVVWVPAAAYLALSGDIGKAVLLTAWGTIVVGLIDNLLYPLVVGHRLRLHTLAVFIAIVGGLMVFGASGVILGPVILAITLALVEIWRRRTAGGRAAEEGVHTSAGVVAGHS